MRVHIAIIGAGPAGLLLGHLLYRAGMLEQVAVDLHGLTGGKNVMVYGQTELTKDLMDARAVAGLKTVYEAEDVSVHDFDSERPRVRYVKDGVSHEIRCDFIAGCDGFHGVCRATTPNRGG